MHSLTGICQNDQLSAVILTGAGLGIYRMDSVQARDTGLDEHVEEHAGEAYCCVWFAQDLFYIPLQDLFYIPLNLLNLCLSFLEAQVQKSIE